MNWLKSIASALGAAGVAFLAFLAVAQVNARKAQAEKWRARADDAIKSNRDDALKRAMAAREQAKLADARAEEAKAKIGQRIDQLGEKDEEVADVVDRWRKSGGVRDHAG